ncbi:MAG: leucine-rich repeat domain-containing protein [Candidatus Hermodarchaeota archaeon]
MEVSKTSKKGYNLSKAVDEDQLIKNLRFLLDLNYDIEKVDYFRPRAFEVDEDLRGMVFQYMMRGNHVIALELSGLGFHDGTRALTTIPEEIFQLTHLEILNLADNSIREIPKAILNLKKLKRLDLRENALSTIPEWIDGLTSLEELYLNSNVLTQLPASIGNLHNLRILSILSCRLESLPESLKNLEHLEEFAINSFRSDRYPDVLKKLQEQGCDIHEYVIP